MTKTDGLSLAIYLPDLSGGGAERLHARLLPEFLRLGFKVTFLLDQERGELLAPVQAMGASIVSLGVSRQLKAFPKLVGYLKTAQPYVMIANMEHMNVMAIWAKRLAGVRTKIIVTQHNTFSEQAKRRSWQWRVLPFLYRMSLPAADRIIAVSNGVADDLAACAALDRKRISVIYNGVVTRDFEEKTFGKPDHPFFSGTTPVVLAMGRMVEQKDFATLLEAFAQMENTSARLVILGDGPLRPDLDRLIGELGIADRVAMPGFRENALAYLSKATLFVLSSRFEGFGNVIAEALACGTPVVSTNCPHGPAEILEDGTFGVLAPVGDAAGLARAMDVALTAPVNKAALIARGRTFSVSTCAEAYAEVIS